MKPVWKKALLGFVAFVGIGACVAGGWACVQIRAFDASMDKVYEVPLTPVTLSTEPAVLARGKHVAGAIAACTASDCHGTDLAGGKMMDVGPVMTVAAPNVTAAGLGAAYNDAELYRLLRHGVKKDGRSIRLMSVQEFNWLPESDVIAVISWVRTMPPVEKSNAAFVVKPLGKILDRRDAIPIDVARRIDHAKIETAPPPSPTTEYGQFLGRLCSGCHGPTFAGGPIPGAPPELPKPLNLTPHETGLKGYTYEDFWKVIDTGARRDGRKLDPFMPFESLRQMDEIERRALFAFLSQLPPKVYGDR